MYFLATFTTSFGSAPRGAGSDARLKGSYRVNRCGDCSYVSCVLHAGSGLGCVVVTRTCTTSFSTSSLIEVSLRSSPSRWT